MLPMAFNPLNRWNPSPFSISNGQDERDPNKYLEVIKQFKVDDPTNIRYQPSEGNTWCSLFLWDVTRAFACEIPHWWIGKEQTANMMIQWLDNEGPNYGWQKLPDLHTAQAMVQQGMPVVIMYNNPGFHGHCGILLPDGTLAQAGLTCFFGKPITQGFGNLPILFYGHS
jgi:hypothetical protein